MAAFKDDQPRGTPTPEGHFFTFGKRPGVARRV